MADKTVIGKITQVVGAVLDIKLRRRANFHEINDAIRIPTHEMEADLVVEVAQHLGDDTVRCIAMGTTDGLVRGMDAQSPPVRPITVPVGENTLGQYI